VAEKRTAEISREIIKESSKWAIVIMTINILNNFYDSFIYDFSVSVKVAVK